MLTNIKSVSINVSQDNNLMHIFYTSQITFSVDTTDTEILLLCLSKSFSESYYKRSDVYSLPDHPTRKLLFTLTTHYHFDHCSGDKKVWEMFPGIQQYKYVDECGDGDNKCNDKCVDGCNDSVNKCNDSVNEGHINGCNDNNHNNNNKHNNINNKHTNNINTYNINNNNNTFKYTPLSKLPHYIQAIHTPCHTKDSTCYIITNKWLCTGDTIFFLGCGKFFEGTAEDMFNNIQKIKKLDDNLILLYGHDYSETNMRFTGIKLDKGIFLKLCDEKIYNKFFCVESVNELIILRKLKDEFK